MNDTYAIVKNGVVINLILWDGDTEQWSPPDGATAVEVSGGAFVTIGSLYDGADFANPTGVTAAPQ